ncbi:hypothetical protein [Streptomyces sp. NBC_01198]|uniref:hypothetical protein n=1 Tax=Streptomyces sp. NBC_01198 TaxID=2903769 RepID=UPI002E11DB58|nr:hypothetical protein OG702_32130 [Streptomyces sp. NBC_01198]
MRFDPTEMDNLDADTLKEAAEEAHDKDSGEPYVTVYSLVESSDDLMAESNYSSALELLNAAAVWNDKDADEYVTDQPCRDWLFGNTRELRVLVYEEPNQCTWDECGTPAEVVVKSDVHEGGALCQWHADWITLGDPFDTGWTWERGEPVDANATVTPYEPEFSAAFKMAVVIAQHLRDYPFLDEDDYSEREWKAYEAVLTEAVEYAQRAYAEDSDSEVETIAQRFYEEGHHRDQWCRAEDVNWSEVADEYREIRDEHFTSQAQEIADELSARSLLVMDGRGYPGPGQLVLPGV